MNQHAPSRNAKPSEARAGLVDRLRPRQLEMVDAIVARIRNVAPDPASDGDVQYEEGQRTATASCVEYALTGLELGPENALPIPPEAIAQAHRVARTGVSLEAVLLRHTAGHRLFGEFVMEEARHFPPQALRHVVGLQWSLFERLVATVSAEYKHELDRAERIEERHLVERTQRLLAGEPGDLDGFGYRLDAHHVGVIAVGAQAREAIRRLAASLDYQVLTVSRDESTVWAWLGGHRGPTSVDIHRALSSRPVRHVIVTVGEPACGVEGWRLTHRQAQEALRVALRQRQTLTSYHDVLLEAAILRDEPLARALVERYLAPLADWKDGPTVLPETARAYFSSGHNGEATRLKLNVDRSTIRARVRAIEERLGCPLSECQAELEVALRLGRLYDISGFPHPGNW